MYTISNPALSPSGIDHPTSPSLEEDTHPASHAKNHRTVVPAHQHPPLFAVSDAAEESFDAIPLRDHLLVKIPSLKGGIIEIDYFANAEPVGLVDEDKSTYRHSDFRHNGVAMEEEPVGLVAEDKITYHHSDFCLDGVAMESAHHVLRTLTVHPA